MNFSNLEHDLVKHQLQFLVFFHPNGNYVFISFNRIHIINRILFSLVTWLHPFSLLGVTNTLGNIDSYQNYDYSAISQPYRVYKKNRAHLLCLIISKLLKLIAQFWTCFKPRSFLFRTSRDSYFYSQ